MLCPDYYCNPGICTRWPPPQFEYFCTSHCVICFSWQRTPGLVPGRTLPSEIRAEPAPVGRAIVTEGSFQDFHFLERTSPDFLS